MSRDFSRLIVYAPQALALTLALTMLISQWREVYISIAERSDLWQTGFGIGGLVWLSAVIYSWNWAKTNSKVDACYPEHARITVDQELKEWRDVKPLGSAVLIPASVALGMVWAAAWCSDVLESLNGSTQAELIASLSYTRNKLWVSTPVVAASLIVPLFLLAGTRRVHPLVNVSRWPVTLGVIAAPLVLEPEQLIDTSRHLGPIAIFALQGIALVTVSRFLIETIPVYLFKIIAIVQTIPAFAMAILVQKSPRLDHAYVKKSLTSIIVLALPLLTLSGILWGWTALTRQNPLAQGEPIPPIRPSPQDTKEFYDWVVSRSALPSTGVPRARFPIFVVAAQGGGIYAASASMALLTTLQRECPAFSEHLYAISAVSGGAIGSAAYTGLVVDKNASAPSCSTVAPVAVDFKTPVETIATDDHLSPILASTLTDWVSKFLLLNPWADTGGEPRRPKEAFGLLTDAREYASLDLPAKRSELLTASFASSYRAAISATSPIALSQRFSTFWTHHPRAPFLMLNATSAETGHRVAFSPLPLRGIGDGTLNSARDIIDNWTLVGSSRRALEGETLIGAAITSARFPGILPGWAVHHERPVYDRNDKQRRRMNLVDGGYFDPSGAATAFDILEHLLKLIEANGLQNFVSLHLILLTDSGTLTDLASADGSRAVDIGVPVQALLNSRSMLARRATLRAINELPPDVDVIQVVLDDELVSLPLGWKLSRTSHRVIAAMMGDASACDTSPRADIVDTELRRFNTTRSPSHKFQSTVGKNSCAQAHILKLLNR